LKRVTLTLMNLFLHVKIYQTKLHCQQI
jgi:hypothetical protein